MDVDESVSVDEDVVRSNKSLLLILDAVLALGDGRGGEDEEISGVSSPGGGGGGGASISFGFMVVVD